MMNIYSAVYSGVPVFEMMVDDVPVMRRSSDNFMNATHILKVAGFSKPKRTKILEREVLQGEHEKIQGGYGKYQGTWIPFEISKQLAHRYQVDATLAPIFQFDPTKDKLGLKPPTQKAERDTTHKSTPSRKKIPVVISEPSESESVESTPSPILGPTLNAPYSRGVISPSVLRLVPLSLSHSLRQKEILASISNDANYCVILNLLRFSTYQFDINFLLDHEGNTSLHWACALGNPEIVRHLIKHDANIGMLNAWGESALVLAVLRSDNYQYQNFSTMLKLLKNVVLAQDALGQTLLHHIIQRCINGHQAGFYYFDALCMWISKKGDRVAGFVDVRDENGDTPLHLATRFHISRCVQVLLSLGAKYHVPNNKGLTAFDIAKNCGISSLFQTAASDESGEDSCLEEHKSIDAVKTILKESQWQKRVWSKHQNLPVSRLLNHLELGYHAAVGGDEDDETTSDSLAPPTIISLAPNTVPKASSIISSGTALGKRVREE